MTMLSANRSAFRLRVSLYFHLVAIFVLTAVPLAHAQFKIEEILDKGPLRLSAGVDVRLSRFGEQVVANATTFAILRDAQGVIAALLPGINKRNQCTASKDVGIVVTDITPTQMIAGASQQFAFRAVVQVSDCQLNSLSGQISIVLPVNVRTRANSIYLQTAPPQTESDLTAFGIHVPAFIVQRKIAKFTPGIDEMVKKLNSAINTQMNNPGLRAIVKTYHLQLNQPTLTLDQGDLRVAVEMTGQASTQTVNSWFNN